MAAQVAHHIAKGGKTHSPKSAPARSLTVLCANEGRIIERCQSCKGEGRHVRKCSVWKTVTREPVGSAKMNCQKCKAEGLGYAPATAAARQPQWHEGILRYDHETLYPGLPGKRFNPSLIAWEGGYVFCWRDGWEGSNLWACRMDAGFRPVGAAVKLDIAHPAANYGREDPQLFIHDGGLEVAFVGVLGHKGKVTQTNVLYARLNPDLTVASVHAPVPPGVPTGQWQKNWQWFSHGGRRYAVYSVAPHRVLEVDGDRAEWAHECPTRFQWRGGEMRGGATPYRLDGEYWCFFHDKVRGRTGRLLYRTGLYTFAAEPPFRPLRYVPDPILSADPLVQPADRNYSDVVFPRGAVRDGADWVLSCGVHDRFTELHRLDHAALMRRLVRVASPASFTVRTGGGHVDEDIFASVAGHDEYGLSRFDLVGAAVLDVGAHVGCFAHAAKSRGAHLVHSYEPYPASFAVLTRNADRMKTVAMLAAVGVGAGKGRFPADVEVKHSGGWSVVPDPTGPVDVLGLDDMILWLAASSEDGRVNLLKIDVEGAEWGAFQGALRLDLVDAIVGEWHEYDRDGRVWKADDLRPLLPDFVVTIDPPAPGATWGLFHAVRRA